MIYTTGIPFLETSAKDSTNVEQAFITMAAEIKARMAQAPAKTGAASTIQVSLLDVVFEIDCVHIHVTLRKKGVDVGKAK